MDVLILAPVLVCILALIVMVGAHLAAVSKPGEPPRRDPEWTKVADAFTDDGTPVAIWRKEDPRA